MHVSLTWRRDTITGVYYCTEAPHYTIHPTPKCSYAKFQLRSNGRFEFAGTLAACKAEADMAATIEAFGDGNPDTTASDGNLDGAPLIIVDYVDCRF